MTPQVRLQGVEPEGDVGLLSVSIWNLNGPDDPAVIHHLDAHSIIVGKRVKNYFPAFTGDAKRSLRNGHVLSRKRNYTKLLSLEKNDSTLFRRNEHKIPDELFAQEFFLGFCDVFEEEGLGEQGTDSVLLDTRDKGWENGLIPGGAADQLEVLEVEGSDIEGNEGAPDGTGRDIASAPF